MYRAGKGVKKDFSKAFLWFGKAAEQGFTKAQYNLGNLYEYGWGVTADREQALHWYQAAAEQGHRQAKRKVEQLAASMAAKNGEGISESMIDASASGDLGRVRELLRQGADIDATDSDQRTALYSAVLNGHTQTVAELLKTGADVSIGDRLGNTPLHTAVRLDRFEETRLLLNAGADIEQRDPVGNTALILAAGKGLTAITALLIKRGANPRADNKKGQSAMQLAWQRKHHKVVIQLEQAGIERPTPTKQRVSKRAPQLSAFSDGLVVAGEEQPFAGWPTLNIAAWRGSDSLVDALLKQGADINARDPEGLTALARAAWQGQIKIVQRLLNAGANPEIATERGSHPPIPCSKKRTDQDSTGVALPRRKG
ncbi:MAG: hypothetical protein DIZ77_05510 [endosymbiont of Seepiophila jonesi]|uniref:Uncharacterized protein n=1 Tax=endosymbiont of Lamellibrachia luymesi TaxID=2200907 RepID=A0A370DW47_9GAMM|nr:MAG: hypothetical protein DIZ79_13905 [endosymbiont of Lamellibrachia luymesi]RDH93650.1 MAG: hypothetical protein DIZ77_05510 [endosymbiont of Seepiophila jonesi]